MKYKHITYKKRPIYTYICEGCGKEFQTKHKETRFCTKDCYHKSNPKKQIVNQCPICKSFFETKYKRTKYCSNECMKKGLSRKVTVPCFFCGKDVTRIKSQMKKAKIFCSHECYAKYSSDSKKGLLMKDGISHSSGYVFIYQQSKKYKQEHRLVMEKYLGRELLPSEIVHHKDGDKTNNSIENLEIVTRSEHINIHRKDLLAGRGY